MKKILFVLAVATLFTVTRIYAQVSVGVRIGIAPPPLPVYVQPPCPVDGYLWEPGYWAYDDGYYWVPGAWVAPPDPGLLWTPCYWGWDDGFYAFHSGYWGPHVGFYGGINYGFGYPGFGFYGGVWSGRSFRYNTAVFNVNRGVIHNTYASREGIHPFTSSRASFNGRGGVNAQPRPEDRSAMSEHHVQPTRSQIAHQQTARSNPAQHMSVNHGRPATAAVSRANTHAVSSPQHTANHAEANRAAGATHNAPRHQANLSPNFHNGREANGAAFRQPQQHTQQPRAEQQHMAQPRMQQHMNGGAAPHMGGGGPPRMEGGGGGHMGGGGAPHGGGGGGGHERR
jgi:hypothetical protein